MTELESGGARQRLLGRGLFLGGLLLWGIQSLRALPDASYNIQWMFSLEQGDWTPREWLHPLFVPLLSLLKGALGLLGYEGPMLLPTQGLNLAVGLLTLGLLFAVAERRSGDSLLAAGASLALGFEGVYWQFALAADPYALGSLFSFLSVALLFLDRPARPLRRHALAGVAAGITVGFSAAGLMLGGVAAVAAWRERGLHRATLARVGAFALGAALTLVVIYAAFMAYHGVPVDRLGPSLLEEIFHSGKEPGGTIYETGSVWAQLTGFALSVNGSYFGWFLGSFAEFALGAVGGLLLWHWRRGGLDERERRLAWVVLANVLIYSLFFVFNDNTNGFICSVLLPLPVLVAVLASRSGVGPWPRRVVLAALALLLTGQIGAGLYDTRREDFVFLEARHLAEVIPERGVLVMPGCPFPELLYERRFDVVRYADVVDPHFRCIVPVTAPEALAPRLRDTLAAGRAVTFLAAPPEGYLRLAPQRMAGLYQQQQQLFETPPARPEAIARELASLRAFLEARFETRCEPPSPGGWTYCRLVAPRAKASPPPPSTLGRLEGLVDGSARQDARASRRGYLEAWLEASPEDDHAREDLRRLEEELR